MRRSAQEIVEHWPFKRKHFSYNLFRWLQIVAFRVGLIASSLAAHERHKPFPAVVYHDTAERQRDKLRVLPLR